jgi:hypothetical protein
MNLPSDLSRTLLRYCEPNARRAIFEVGVTAIPLVLLWAAMWWSLECRLLADLAAGRPAGRLYGAAVHHPA